jgi:alkylated DNA repair protein (DNA oxidative demethylase)
MTPSLFENISDEGALDDSLGLGTAILRGFALEREVLLLDALSAVAARSSFRHMVTPGGFRMSVAMTNCGSLGWVTDRKGYRYDSVDPETRAPWPPMPQPFLELAHDAAKVAGFPEFVPDGCLINRYEPGARLTLHQDKDERDYEQPIVSVSLGLPAVFLFGGEERGDKTTRVPVDHGDVLVWGGPARLRYHGVMPLKTGLHPLAGGYRFNLTFRKAA